VTSEQPAPTPPRGNPWVKIVRQRRLLPPEYWHLIAWSGTRQRPFPETLRWCAEVYPCDDCMYLDTENLRLEPMFRELADAIDERRARWAASGRESRAGEHERLLRERDATGRERPAGGEDGSILTCLREGEDPAEGWRVRKVFKRYVPYPWETNVGVWLYVMLFRDPGVESGYPGER
jgi:hypothetical protein